MTDTKKPDACREAFEAEYVTSLNTARIHEVIGMADYTIDEIKGLRCGDKYGEAHLYLNNLWRWWQAAWNARAQVAAPSEPIGYISKDGLNRLLAKSSRETKVSVESAIKSNASHARTIPLFLGVPAAQLSEDKRDTERLDWLDKMNSALNQQYGTNYRWKLILSQNIVRLMVGVQQRGFVGDVDLNDAQSGENSFTSCREAIDAVRASTGDKA